MKNLGVVFMSIVLPLFLTAGPIDGSMWLGAPSQTATLFTQFSQYWLDCQIPANGGVASFTAGSYCYVSNSIPNWTLRGLDFRDAKQTSGQNFGGLPVILTGDDAFISSVSPTGVRLDLPLCGTGANTVTKKDWGCITIARPMTSMETCAVADGKLKAVRADANGFVFADNSVAKAALRGGRMEWRPESGSAAASIPGVFSVGPGGGVLSLAEGSSLSLGGLVFEPGGCGIVVNEKGFTAPGVTIANFEAGLVDPRLVTRDMSVTGGPFSFLRYDDGTGLTPVLDTELVPLAVAGADDLAVVTPDTTAATVSLDESRHVKGLVINDRANLSLAEGVTLTVGDGTNPAGIIFREPKDPPAGATRNGYTQFAGAGTLDFGRSHGVIWKGAPLTGRGLDLLTRITGSAGVTFASRSVNEESNSASWTLFRFYKNTCGWTGPTYVSNARLFIVEPDSFFPDGGDVYALGGRHGHGAQLYFNGTKTLNQHLHLSGFGGDGFGAPDYSDGYGVIFCEGGFVTFNGPVTGDDDWGILMKTASRIRFDAPVDGPGHLFVRGAGDLSFGTTNHFTGGLSISADAYGSPRITVAPTATLGTGPVNVSAGSLTFENRTHSVPNTLTGNGDGKLFVNQSVMDFSGTQVLSHVFLDVNTRTNFCSSVGVGPAADFGTLIASNACGTAEIRGIGKDSHLMLGSDTEDFILSAGLSDGTGKLAVTKKGSNTLTFVSSKTYTGETRIDGGTLRLEGSLLESPSVSYWLDASAPGTVMTDESGAVTNWVSRNGNGVCFCAQPECAAPVLSADAMAGKPAVTFGEGGATALASDRVVCQRTVFFVWRIKALPDNVFGEMFGWWKNDYAVRFSGIQLEVLQSSYKYNTTPSVFSDGVETTSYKTYKYDETHTLVVTHDRDETKGLFRPADFIASLGCAQIYRESGGVRTPFYYRGDIAEVIAFDRVLTKAERRTLENYLTTKWQGGPCHTTVDPIPSVLAPQTDLVLSYGATLDLHGATQTVASLTGEGTITNSSIRPAVLLTTGACSFSGRLAGNVTLVRAGAGADTLRLMMDGTSSLTFDGGSTTLEPYNVAPPMEHLAYWLDASDPSAVSLAADGSVTNWRTRAGFVSDFSKVSSKSAPAAYVQDDPSGLGTVNFTGNGKNVAQQSLVADKKSVIRTIFLVSRLEPEQTSSAYLWGPWNCDLGLRVAAATDLQNNGRVTYYIKSDTVRVNGVDTDLSRTKTLGTEPFCLTVRLGDGHPDDQINYNNATLDRASAIGATCGNGSARQFLREVIGYTNALTDTEITAVESYLMNKWSVAGHIPRPPVTNVFASGGSLVLRNGAAVDLNGGSLETATFEEDGSGSFSGDLSVTDSIIVKVHPDGTVDGLHLNGSLTLGSNATLIVDDWHNLAPVSCRLMLVSVTGTVSGDFASSNTGGAWKWGRVGKTWYVWRPDGTVLVFR